MAVTEYKYAGTAANVEGAKKWPWENPDNAKNQSGFATCGTGFANKDTDWLLLTNFGFTSSDLPSGCTIDGIEFIVRHMRDLSPGGGYDKQVYLQNSSGNTGNNMASASDWTTNPTTATYGGATNMCGTSLTQTDIVASTFGIKISAYTNPNAGNVGIDYIQIRVYYTEGGGATSLLNSLLRKPFRHMLIR